MRIAETKTSTLVLLSILIWTAIGGLGAYDVAREPIAYIASMTYGIYFLFLLLPIITILFVLTIISAIKNKMKYALPLFIGCLALPTSFVGGLKIFEAVGLAEYKDNPINEMRPIGSELKNRIVLLFMTTASQDEINKFDEEILRKKIPQTNGVLLEFADGICNFSYPRISPEATIVDIPFCKDATEEQKAVIREKIISSPLVYTAFEDMNTGEVKKIK
jgi:hypothetical protein